MMSLWTKLCSSLRSFRLAHRGNVAITFALATLPLVTFVGFAVDYSRANAVKVSLQSALDSTALMLSKEATTDTSTQLSTNARNYFLALFTRPEATNVVVTASYDPDGGSALVVSASADVPTYLLGLLPGQAFQTLPVSASSTAKWGSNRLRVALVLDNTGSMAESGKMTALISATKSLLTQLQGAASKNGDVYVSIVPFVKDVNLGPGNWKSDYIYWGTAPGPNPNNPDATTIQDTGATDNTSWDATNGQCEDQGGTVLGTSSSFKPRSSCLTKPSCSISGNVTQTACTNAGSCSVSGFTSQSACTGAGTCSLSGFTSQSTCTAAGTCSVSGFTNQSTCTAAGTCSIAGNKSQSSCTSAGVCSKSQFSSSSKCTKNGGTWTPGTWTGATWTAATWTATPGTWTAGIWNKATTMWVPNAHSTTWTGCVMDRGNSTSPDTTYNFDTNASPPDAVTPRWSSLYPAEQFSPCPQAVMGLSYDWASMTTLVNNMSPGGSTNQGLGLQLGWLSLVGGGPFTMPPLEAGYNYTQVIILLTDGLNTQDRWYGDGSSLGTSDDAKIDAREQSTCANFKAASISNPTNVIYTIQVDTGGDPTSTLLQGCASSPDKFYLLTSSSQILNVFTKIGNDLTQLRVAK
ncbi:MAG: TadE/TadG family type IV pilus assembly protein [Pseudolabrys sp.]